MEWLSLLGSIPWGEVVPKAAEIIGYIIAGNAVVVTLLPRKYTKGWGILHGDILELFTITRIKNKFLQSAFYSSADYVEGLGIGMHEGKQSKKKKK